MGGSGGGGILYGGAVGRGGAERDKTPAGLFAQETTVPRASQGTEDNFPGGRIYGSVNKRNPM